MTWPGEIYPLRQMLGRAGTANLVLTGAAPIREDPMKRTSREPTLLTMTRGRPSCPSRLHRTAAASVRAPGSRDQSSPSPGTATTSTARAARQWHPAGATAASAVMMALVVVADRSRDCAVLAGDVSGTDA